MCFDSVYKLNDIDADPGWGSWKVTKGPLFSQSYLHKLVCVSFLLRNIHGHLGKKAFCVHKSLGKAASNKGEHFLHCRISPALHHAVHSRTSKLKVTLATPAPSKPQLGEHLRCSTKPILGRIARSQPLHFRRGGTEVRSGAGAPGSPAAAV